MKQPSKRSSPFYIFETYLILPILIYMTLSFLVGPKKNDIFPYLTNFL